MDLRIYFCAFWIPILSLETKYSYTAFQNDSSKHWHVISAKSLSLFPDPGLWNLHSWEDFLWFTAWYIKIHAPCLNNLTFGSYFDDKFSTELVFWQCTVIIRALPDVWITEEQLNKINGTRWHKILKGKSNNGLFIENACLVSHWINDAIKTIMKWSH